jgi:hypothetical protein
MQLISERTRGAIEDYLYASCAAIREHLGNGRAGLPTALNIALSNCEALPAIRCLFEDKVPAVLCAVDVFAELLPKGSHLGGPDYNAWEILVEAPSNSRADLGVWDDLPDIEEMADLDARELMDRILLMNRMELEYLNDATETPPDQADEFRVLTELRRDAEDDSFTPGDITIHDAGAIFRVLQDLGPDDRISLLDAIHAHIQTRLGDEQTRITTVRMIAAIRVLPTFSSWRHAEQDWKRQVSEFGKSHWSSLKPADVTTNDELREDVWLRLLLTRARLAADPDFLDEIELEDFFRGGSPFPLLQPQPEGTLAHSLLTAAIGLRVVGASREWSEPDLTALIARTESRLRDAADVSTLANRPAVRSGPKGEFESGSVISSPTRLATSTMSTAARFVFVFFCVEILRYGDQAFLARMMDTWSGPDRDLFLPLYEFLTRRWSDVDLFDILTSIGFSYDDCDYFDALIGR